MIEDLLLRSESKTLEFKRDLSSLDPILKTIVAFANTAGGIIVIGRAPDGTITGIKDVFKAEEALANAIADGIRPILLPEIEITTFLEKNLLIVKVAHWKGSFYLKKEGAERGVYIRLGSTSRPAGEELLGELKRSFLDLSYDQQPIPDLSKRDLDLEYASRFFKSEPLNEEKMRSLGILVPFAGRIVPSIGGLILFGKKEARQQFVPDARVGCARFLGNDKSEFLDRYESEGTILDAIEEVPKFIARNTRLAAQFGEMRRKDIPEYPPSAIRETLLNALAHADYSIRGTYHQIAIFDNRLEIQSPGMLPFGFTLDDFKSGVSRIRNRVITRVFHQMRLMEVWGSGYKRIIESCVSGNYPEPKWEELATNFRVTFFPHSQTQLVFREGRATPLEPEELMDRQKMILRLFKKRESLPFREIYKRMTPKISERMLRYDLAELKRKGLITSKGKGRAIVWQVL